MRILITGSHGVLGVALKRELRSRGHGVYGCDLAHSDDPQEIRADVSNSREIEAAFRFSQPTTVMHLAGEFGRVNGKDFFERLWTTNCIGTHNVIEECIQYGARLVFASSSEAYGDLADYQILDEHLLADRVPVFHGEYALTKWAGEKQVEIARNRSILRAVSLRFFNVYGPGEHFSPYRSVVCQFIYNLLHRRPIHAHKGSRDFLYISDWATTVANIADAGRFDNLGEHAYNIGGDAVTDIHKLAWIVAGACGISPDDPLISFDSEEPGNVAHKMPSIELARRDLEHNPRVGLAAGIKATVEWMRKRYNIPENRN